VSLLGAFALLAALSGGNPAIAAEAEEQGSAAAGSPFGGAFRAGGGSRGPMLLVLRIAEALQLSDEQTVKLAAEFRRVAAQRRTMLAEKTALEAKLEAQLARKPVDEATVSSLTEQLVALERNLVLLPDELWKSIQPLLTVEQRARLVLLRGKMKKQVDGARQRRRGRGQDRGAADPRDE
jgi:hypothetical protein